MFFSMERNPHSDVPECSLRQGQVQIQHCITVLRGSFEGKLCPVMAAKTLILQPLLNKPIGGNMEIWLQPLLNKPIGGNMEIWSGNDNGNAHLYPFIDHFPVENGWVTAAMVDIVWLSKGRPTFLENLSGPPRHASPIRIMTPVLWTGNQGKEETSSDQQPVDV